MDGIEDIELRYMTFCKGPTLKLRGRWLERAGFAPGTIVRIAVTRDRLVFEAAGKVSELTVRLNGRSLRCAKRAHAAACQKSSQSDRATRDECAHQPVPKLPTRM